MAKIKDTYLNFFSLEVTANAGADDLASNNQNTAAGPSTQVAWRIHLIEFLPHMEFAATSILNIALSTRKGQSSIPELTDKGTVAVFRVHNKAVTSGIVRDGMPRMYSYLPPIIIAAPNLTVYCQCTTDDSAQRLAKHEVRIGFTAVSITDSGVYNELFQTWNFAD